MLQLFLCSQSPRRRSLLREAGYQFQTLPVKVSEIPNENLNVMDQIREIAISKARAVLEDGKLLKTKDYLLLSADTAVIFDNQIIGKPENSADARAILKRLSGRRHEVVTGVCLKTSQVETSFFEISDVKFNSLSADEIEKYVDSGEPNDKAGAYAIQGNGGKFVASYSGSFSNIVGLPMEVLSEHLENFGIVPDE